MKKLLISLTLAAMFLSAPLAEAHRSDSKSIRDYDHGYGRTPVVAFYLNGTHGIPTQSGITHTGMDLVFKGIEKGTFKQVFVGKSKTEGFHSHITFWKPMNGTDCCPFGTKIEKPNPGWGTYLMPDVDYCVTDFKI